MPTVLAFVGRADGIATIFDQPQIMLRGQRHDGIEIKRIAECVGQHDGLVRSR